MRTTKSIKTAAICLFVLPLSGINILAQDPPKRTSQREVTTMEQPVMIAPAMPMAAQAKVMFTEAGFNKLVTGKPYSAQVTNESIQTLADGNRIVHSSTSTVYRDSEGRTRHEQGPAGAPSTVIISDPTSGTSYILRPDDRIANKTNIRIPGGSAGASVFTFDYMSKSATPPSAAVTTTTKTTTTVASAAGDVRAAKMAAGATGYSITQDGGDLIYFSTNEGGAEPVKESLGKQTIEGVEAEGTRTTITIPPGQIGNELPIRIVSESWYSPDLQMLVMTKHSDPRSGETTYRVTNINRSEPDHALFVVPADYTVKDLMPATPSVMRKRVPNSDNN